MSNHPFNLIQNLFLETVAYLMAWLQHLRMIKSPTKDFEEKVRGFW
jgi:hypothetical protein